FRGVLPIGLAVHPRTGWLLAAEAGINAVAVIDPAAGRVLGHARVRRWAPPAALAEGRQRDAEPPRPRAPVRAQRQFLRRCRCQCRWPPLAGWIAAERLDGKHADGIVRRSEEGLPFGLRSGAPALRRLQFLGSPGG